MYLILTRINCQLFTQWAFDKHSFGRLTCKGFFFFPLEIYSNKVLRIKKKQASSRLSVHILHS